MSKQPYSYFLKDETQKAPQWFPPYIAFMFDGVEYKTKQSAIEAAGEQNSHLVSSKLKCPTTVDGAPSNIEHNAKTRFKQQFFDEYSVTSEHLAEYFWTVCEKQSALKNTNNDVAEWFTELMGILEKLRFEKDTFVPEPYTRNFLGYWDKLNIAKYADLDKWDSSNQMNLFRKPYFNQNSDIPVAFMIYFWEVANWGNRNNVCFESVSQHCDELLKHVREYINV